MSASKSQTKPQEKSFKIIMMSAGVGILRGIVGFPLEQPLESIKTQWQANPAFKHEMQVSRAIYANKGIKGFYAGSLPNFTRMFLKNVYRYPLMISLPHFFEQRLVGADNRKTSKLLTGFSIALFESFVTCPIERAKVYFMTEEKAERGGTKRLLAERAAKGGLARELFRGFTPLLTRQSVAWITFLQADLLVKKLIRKYKQIPDDQNIPSRYLVGGSFFVSLINVIMVMPFDAMKTMMQRAKPTDSYKNTFQTVYQSGGMKGFFVGWRLRYMLYLLQALFTVDIIERFENRLRGKVRAKE